MADILKRIETYKRQEIAAAKRARPLATIEGEARAAAPPRGFLRAIEQTVARGLKILRAGKLADFESGNRQSLSMGIILETFDSQAIDRPLLRRRA